MGSSHIQKKTTTAPPQDGAPQWCGFVGLNPMNTIVIFPINPTSPSYVRQLSIHELGHHLAMTSDGRWEIANSWSVRDAGVIVQNKLENQAKLQNILRPCRMNMVHQPQITLVLTPFLTVPPTSSYHKTTTCRTWSLDTCKHVFLEFGCLDDLSYIYSK